jgi:hypothetical protein
MAKLKENWRNESRSGSPGKPSRALGSALADKTRAMLHIRTAARGLRASGLVLAFPKNATAKAATIPTASIAASRRSAILPVLVKVSIALILGAGVIFEAFGLL